MKIVSVILGVLLAAPVAAQVNKPLKVNVALGYGIQPVSGARGGILAGVEPRYSLSNRLDLGVRFSGVFPSQAVPAAVYQADRYASTPVVSVLATATYWLSLGRIRPYVSIGLGNYWATSSTYFTEIRADGSASVNSIGRSVSRAGSMVRAGVQTGCYHLAAEYNIVGSTNQQDPDYRNAPILGTLNGQPLYGNTTEVINWTTPNAYLGLQVGIDIGGRRR